MKHTPHPAPAPPVRPFTPVPVRPRHDGWTPQRQVEFIEALAATGCISEAAARVGMSSHSAYKLRLRDDAMDFRAAWDAALTAAVRLLSEGAFSRAVHGVMVPHYYRGEKVGEHRRYNEGLTRFLLQHLDPLNFAPGLIYNARNLDEERIAAIGNAVLAIREAAEPDRSAGEPGTPSAHLGEMPAEAAARATAEAAIAETANDGDIPTEGTEVGGDASPPSVLFERWGDENFPTRTAV